jgi:hypothetical protein
MSAQLRGWSQSVNDHAASNVEERRKNQRHITVLQVAKLVTEHCEELCIIRDISGGGLKAEIYCALEVGEKLRVHFKSGYEVGGHVAWVEDSQAGIEFDEGIEAELLLVRREHDLEGYPLRSPRIKVDMPGTMRVHGEQVAIHVCDISQSGCRVHSDMLLKPGTGCEIALPGLGYRMAAVRWFRDGQAGIMLHERLTYQDFALWRHRLGAGGPEQGVSRA